MLLLRNQSLHAADFCALSKCSRTFQYSFCGLPAHNSTGHLRFLSQSSCPLDQRSRLSKLWAPSGGIAESPNEDAHSKLIRAGFIRQAHSGIFHMLPLGYRVQKKVEKLIDKYMFSIGASRLDLSTISSEALWRKSGRLSNATSELFRFKDRRDTKYLLSPTHEEEITHLVANTIKSYRDLPTRLFQISRKYRDELRPRHGLLRAREFIMKDLYTFDHNKSLALETYEQVRTVYGALFDELKIPYLVAEAHSGDMGGNLSHEFQFCTSRGEDHVVSCQGCGYVANEEMAQSAIPSAEDSQDWLNWAFVAPDKLRESAVSSSQRAVSVWRGLSLDKSVLINVWYPLESPSSAANIATYIQPGINTHAVRAILPELDPSIENAGTLWNQKHECNGASREEGSLITREIVNMIDCRVPAIVQDAIASGDPNLPFLPDSVNKNVLKVKSSIISRHPRTHERVNLLRIREGDKCPKCHDGTLKVQLALELGHTFYLGDRYSSPLDAIVDIPAEAQTGSTQLARQQVPMQMGCHGIGVSRMVGAVAEILADTEGLNWPRVIAPYEAVVIPTQGNELEAETIYDSLVAGSGYSSDTRHETLDLVLDDRAYPFPWKMRDADLIGYPVIVVVGRAWKSKRVCEVQCRRLSILEEVPVKDLFCFIEKLLGQL